MRASSIIAIVACRAGRLCDTRAGDANDRTADRHGPAPTTAGEATDGAARADDSAGRPITARGAGSPQRHSDPARNCRTGAIGGGQCWAPAALGDVAGQRPGEFGASRDRDRVSRLGATPWRLYPTDGPCVDRPRRCLGRHCTGIFPGCVPGRLARHGVSPPRRRGHCLTALYRGQRERREVECVGINAHCRATRCGARATNRAPEGSARPTRQRRPIREGD